MRKMIADFIAFLNGEDEVIEGLKNIISSPIPSPENGAFNPPKIMRMNQKKRRRRRGRK